MNTPLKRTLSVTGFDCAQVLLWMAFFASGILCSGTTVLFKITHAIFLK